MNEEMISIITKCAKMEAAFGLLRALMLADLDKNGVLLNESELNLVLTMAGIEPVTAEKAHTDKER